MNLTRLNSSSLSVFRRTNVLLLGISFAGLAALPHGAAVAQPSSEVALPSVLERVEDRFQKNPELQKEREARSSALDKLAFMEGRWDMTLTHFATARTPQRVEKGVRDSKWELDRRWMVSREIIPGKQAVEYLGYDPYRKNWARQYVTSWGRGGMQLLFGQEGWKDTTLPFSGTVYFWGEPAEITLRLVKLSEDEYSEIYDEKLPGGVMRPIIELNYKRQKASPPAPAPPKK